MGEKLHGAPVNLNGKGLPRQWHASPNKYAAFVISWEALGSAL